MGLLDDAIREHLELRREHGADPSEVLRQEREALGSAGRQDASAPEAPAAGHETARTTADEPFAEARHPPAPDQPLSLAEDEVTNQEVESSEALEWSDPRSPEPGRRVPSPEPHADEPPPDPSHIALDQETAEVDMGAMLGVGGEDVAGSAIDQEFGSPGERIGHEDEAQEPWGALDDTSDV